MTSRFLRSYTENEHIDVNEVFYLNGCQFYVDQQFTHFNQHHGTEFGALFFLDKFTHSQKFKAVILK
jgi:hypothetical protein